MLKTHLQIEIAGSGDAAPGDFLEFRSAKNNIYKGKAILNQVRNLLSLISQNPYFPDPRLDIFVSNKWDLCIILLSPRSFNDIIVIHNYTTSDPAGGENFADLRTQYFRNPVFASR